MDKFVSFSGIAAPLRMINVDTDMIIPKQFLKTIKRTGLGKSLFYEMRYDENGKRMEDFVLNKKPYDNLSSLTIQHCDFVIRYETIQEDYKVALLYQAFP